jgi:hypothetical protein
MQEDAMTTRTPIIPALPGQACAGSRAGAAPAGPRRRKGWDRGRNDANVPGRPLAPEVRALPVGDALETAIYLEFLHGYGAAPGVDLGLPKAYAKVDTGAGGGVYRQDFERGITIANLGAETVEIVLERPYYTLTDTAVTTIALPAHSAKVLRATPV